MCASAASDARSMKWGPLMIRWCLYLRHLSGSAYEMLRESGVVKLPSQRTLRDYTYIAKAAAGFSREIDVHLMEAANLLSCPEREKHIVLLMDEMHLREDLVYDRHTGRYNYVHVQYIHIHVYTCTCTCTCTYKDFHTGLYNMYIVHGCVYTCIYMYYTCMPTMTTMTTMHCIHLVRRHTCTCICVLVYTHTCTYICVPTNVHTWFYTCAGVAL